MISPIDIQKKEFSKAVRGYSAEEVDIFLDEIMADYEKLIQENEDLKKELESANEKLDGYKDTEGAVLKTLEAAKALMNDISASAEKRADILIKNAQLDADLKQKQAKDNVERLKEEEAQLTARVSRMKHKLRSYLESELERFDTLSEDIFGIPDGSFLTNTQTAEIKADAVKIDDGDLFKTIMNVRKD